MRFSKILFDLDGTLTASEEGITNSARYAFEKMGRAAPDADTLRKFIGPPLVGAFMEFGGMTEEESFAATERYRERFRTIGWMENRVYTGIPEMLSALKAQGAYIAVASSKPQIFVEKILRYFGLERYFDCVAAVSLENTDADKSSLIRRALRERGTENACMVGDRCFDMEAAKKTGLYAVGCAYGYGSTEELRDSGADAVADTVAELRKILVGDMAYRRGKLVTFEGVDGCGKSTQVACANEYLRKCGREVVLTREPGGCPIGEKIRGILLDVGSKGMSSVCEALLYAASRAEHVRSVIIPALESGKIVLCDRFLDSSVAYQAYGRELDEEYVRQINEVSVQGTTPDRTILLDLSEETARERLLGTGTAPDRMESENAEFFRKVRMGFRALAEREPDRIIRVDASRNAREVSEDVREALRSLLETM